MDQKTNLRHLHILQYLYERTDDEHPASTADITEYLAEKGIAVHRQTIASDVELLINFGFDIITVRSRQNQYFYVSRQFELAELKMMVDAIQAARFVTNKKSEVLTNKLMQLTSNHHASKLNRQLFVAGRVKATNESVLYTVDLLYEAINENKRIQFKYYEYTSDKKKILKHKGYLYEFSPYDLAWYNDSYYVFGYSEKHGKVIKFRVDRIYKPNECLCHQKSRVRHVAFLCGVVGTEGKPYIGVGGIEAGVDHHRLVQPDKGILIGTETRIFAQRTQAIFLFFFG